MRRRSPSKTQRPVMARRSLGTRRFTSVGNRHCETACNTSGSTRVALAKQTRLSSRMLSKSMFRWYRNAARCYVYLSDVSSPLTRSDELFHPPLWESNFRKSRWFTRGWTLRELLAPRSVEFFSRKQKKLGHKTSLTQLIHKITGIPHLALQGVPLSQFSINERFPWKEHRRPNTKKTKRTRY